MFGIIYLGAGRKRDFIIIINIKRYNLIKLLNKNIDKNHNIKLLFINKILNYLNSNIENIFKKK